MTDIKIKPDQWGPDKPGKQWAGTYTVKELTMAEESAISQLILADARVKGLSPTANVKEYDAMRLEHVVKFPETAPKDRKKMPGKLFRLLQRIDQQLNAVSEEELNFLLKSSSENAKTSSTQP